MFNAFGIFRRELEVIRKKKGRYKSCQWRQGKESRFKITASVQGTNAEILQTMPEGARVNATYTLRTSTKLMTSKEGGDVPDMVLIDGNKFLVVRVTPYQNLLPTKHYQVVVTQDIKHED
jgi:hypothetical protein